MNKKNINITSASKVITTLWILCLTFSHAAAAPLLSKKDVSDAKAVQRILDSWNGQPEILDKANNTLTEILVRNPENYLALKEMARFLMDDGYINSRNISNKHYIYTVGNYKPNTLNKAEATVRKAIRTNEKYAEGYVMLGNIQIEQGKLDDAEKSLKQAELLKTNDPWLHLNWAAIYNAKGESSLVQKHCQQALQVTTKNKTTSVYAYDLLNSIYIREGKHKEAVATFKKQLQLEPNSAWIKGNYANYLSETLGHHDDAIAESRAALKIMDYGIGHRILGGALYRKWAEMVANGDIQNADKYFQEAFKHYPQLTDVMAYLASSTNGEQLAKALITRKQVSIDSHAEDGSTALLIATNRNDTKTVKFLLGMNANPNLNDKSGWTPLLSAIDEGNPEIVDMLLTKGADPWVALSALDKADVAELNKGKDIADLLRKRTLLRKQAIMNELSIAKN